jgi:hypothetical protein
LESLAQNPLFLSADAQRKGLNGFMLAGKPGLAEYLIQTNSRAYSTPAFWHSMANSVLFGSIDE